MLTPAPLEASQHARRKRVQDALARGLTTRQIAAEVGCAFGTVLRDLKIIRKEWRDERLADRDAYVDQELAAIAELQGAHRAKALAGSHHSAKVLIDCMRRRSRLLGLDAPERLEVAGQVSITASPEFTILTEAVMEALADLPAARTLVAARLAALAPAGPILEGELVSHPPLSAGDDYGDR